MKKLTAKLRQQQISWNSMLASLRQFFAERQVLEVQTPTLVPSPGVETHLEGFATEFVMGSRRQLLFLPTSPEFHLKKMAFSGWTDIFEIRTCFRNGELSPHHQPEFTMLEWYRQQHSLNEMIEETISLVHTVCDSQSVARPKVNRTTFQKLFRQILEFDLNPQTTTKDLIDLCARLQIHVSAQDSWNDLFHLLLIEKIEPALHSQELTVIEQFPQSQAALSRIEGGWAQRFEAYWHGLELCNGYLELLDSEEQHSRWTQINDERIKLGRRVVALDHELLELMKQPLPPICGNALGVDRLFMSVHGVKQLEHLRLFPFE